MRMRSLSKHRRRCLRLCRRVAVQEGSAVRVFGAFQDSYIIVVYLISQQDNMTESRISKLLLQNRHLTVTVIHVH